MALLVIVGSLQDWPAPFSKKPLRHALDTGLRLLAARVEQHHFADTATQQRFLLDVEFRKGHKNVTLDIVCGQRSIVERFKEEFYVLQKVRVRVQHGVLNIIPIQDGCHLW